MRTLSGTAVVALLSAGMAFAADTAVALAEAPEDPTDAAVLERLDVVDCGGVPHYAFAGEAEDYFPGEGLETEAELYEEAVLDAKTRLYGILSGGDSSRHVELSGFFVARHWSEGPMRHVECMVPVSAVHVSGGETGVIMPPSEETLEKETPEVSGNATSTQPSTPTTP